MPRRMSVWPAASQTRTPVGNRDHRAQRRQHAPQRGGADPLADADHRAVRQRDLDRPRPRRLRPAAGSRGRRCRRERLRLRRVRRDPHRHEHRRRLRPPARRAAPGRATDHSRLRLTSCRRATSTKRAPGLSASATIRSLSSSRQWRRRSTPVMISMRPRASDLSDAPTNVGKLRRQLQPRDGRRPSPDGLMSVFKPFLHGKPPREAVACQRLRTGGGEADRRR